MKNGPMLCRKQFPELLMRDAELWGNIALAELIRD